MALKKPSKPKLVKMPKAPKQSASAEAWRTYDNKLKAAEAENDKRIADYKKKLKAYEDEIKKRDAIRAKAVKVKSKLSGF